MSEQALGFLFCALFFFSSLLNVYLCLIFFFCSRICQFRCVYRLLKITREFSRDFILCSYYHLYYVSRFFFFRTLKQILYEFYINEDHVVYEKKKFSMLTKKQDFVWVYQARRKNV